MGTEFQSRALEDWTTRCGVQFNFIRPPKPVEDAFVLDSVVEMSSDSAVECGSWRGARDVRRELEGGHKRVSLFRWRLTGIVGLAQLPVQLRRNWQPR